METSLWQVLGPSVGGWGLIGWVVLSYPVQWKGKKLVLIYGLGNQISSLFLSVFSSVWQLESARRSLNNAITLPGVGLSVKILAFLYL